MEYKAQFKVFEDDSDCMDVFISGPTYEVWYEDVPIDFAFQIMKEHSQVTQVQYGTTSDYENEKTQKFDRDGFLEFIETWY